MSAPLRRAALYLAFSGVIHAAPVAAWIAEGPEIGWDEPTRVRTLDAAEDAALARAERERALPRTEAETRAQVMREEAARAAARAVVARAQAVRAEATRADAERRAVAAADVARRTAERAEEAREKAAAATRAPVEATREAARKVAETAEEQARDALAARLEADREVAAAQRTVDDTRVEAAKADAMKAEAERQAARVEQELLEAKVAAKLKPEAAPKVEPPKVAPAPKPPVEEVAAAPKPPPEAAPKPQPQAKVQERGDAQASGGNTGPVTRWLAFVRGEGADEGSADPDARYISDRNRRAPEETRAAADVARANGDGRAETEFATRTSTATTPGEAAKHTAARVEIGQPTPPPASPRTPPPAPRTAARTPAPRRDGVRLPPGAVELPYLTEAPGPSPSMPSSDLRLSAGTIDLTSRASPDTTADTARRVARLTPPPPPPAPASLPDAPLPPERPKAPRPPLEDDFWSASTVPTLTDPEVASTDLDATPNVKPDTFLLAAEQADARGWSDLAILDEKAVLSDQARYGARAHVLGAWLSGVDDGLRERWVYPPALRALGVEGTVVLWFYVSRTGAVSSLQIHAGSGNTELDLAALAAVPAKVTAMPAGSGSGQWLEKVFRYRASPP
ncbi:MAG: TonB family protein [Myxococcota bacterium]